MSITPSPRYPCGSPCWMIVLGSLLALNVAIAASPIEIRVDGTTLPHTEQRKIPHSAKTVQFHLGTTNDLTPDIKRVRFILEGSDSDWRQIDGSVTFNVYFYDSNGTRFQQEIFEKRGRTETSAESIENTTFKHHRENITVPEGAQKMSLVISSAGSPTSVGVYLVKDVRVIRLPDNVPPRAEEEIPSVSTMKMPPSAWVADGTFPAMARLMKQSPQSQSEEILAIVDDKNTGHAEWRLKDESAIRTSPGERLAIEWEEVYETAVGSLRWIDYSRLTPGHYRFKMQNVDVWGTPFGLISYADFVISYPYWTYPSFWIGISGGATLAIALGAYGFIRKKEQRALHRVRVLEQERLRIAQDLHDDLGARLTHLSLLSSHSGNRASMPEDRENFQQLSQLTRGLIETLSETIWAVTPKNDNLESLVSFLFKTISSRCKSAGIRCRINAKTISDNRPLSNTLRHHAILSVKEAIKVITEDANVDELNAVIAFEDPFLKITVHAHGPEVQGQNHPEDPDISKIRKWVSAIQGTVSVKNELSSGMAVVLKMPVSTPR